MKGCACAGLRARSRMRACIGVQAALQNTRIPLVEVGEVTNEDEEPELELDDDPAHARPIDTRRVPVIVTASKVRKDVEWERPLGYARVPAVWNGTPVLAVLSCAAC